MTSNEAFKNPWNVQSIYDFQYFDCPSCEFKNHSKQRFLNHAFDFHSDSIEYLSNIRDGSFDDVVCPWDINNIKIEEKFSDKNIDTAAFTPKIEVTELDTFEVNQPNLYEHDFDVAVTSENNVHKTSMPREKNSKTFKCNECNKPFCRKDRLKKHMQNCENMQYCEICKRSFPKEFFENHDKGKHEQILNEKRVSNEINEDPLKSVDENLKEYQCNHCNKKFDHLPYFKLHKSIHEHHVYEATTDQGDQKLFIKRCRFLSKRFKLYKL